MNHITDQSKFQIETDGHLSELLYTLNEKLKTIDIHRTYVPEELRGQGLAGRLNKAALAFAEESGYKVIATCSYTAGYLDRHPEFEHLKLR